MEAKHIDDRISGELDRGKAIRESAREEANAVFYRNCEECERDVEVDFVSGDDVEDFERQEKEKEEQEEDEGREKKKRRRRGGQRSSGRSTHPSQPKRPAY